MSFLNSAILLGTALALIPGQGAFAHDAAQHDAGAVEAAATSQDIDTINVTVSETSKAYSIGVELGTQVRLSVSGAEAKDLHLHGYDVEFEGAPGQPALAVFNAVHSGRFALKMHVEDELLGKHEKPVLFIEVRER